MFEAAFEFVGGYKEVRDDHDQCALANGFGQLVEDLRQLGFTLRFGFLQGVEKKFQMGRRAFSGDVLNDVGLRDKPG